jgi:hypothetical protein
MDSLLHEDLVSEVFLFLSLREWGAAASASAPLRDLLQKEKYWRAWLDAQPSVSEIFIGPGYWRVRLVPTRVVCIQNSILAGRPCHELARVVHSLLAERKAAEKKKPESKGISLRGRAHRY